MTVTAVVTISRGLTARRKARGCTCRQFTAAMSKPGSTCCSNAGKCSTRINGAPESSLHDTLGNVVLKLLEQFAEASVPFAPEVQRAPSSMASSS